LFGNTVLLTIAQLSGIVVSLLLTPYILARIGIEDWGLWVLIGSVLAYVGLLQLGLGRGTIRFIAYHAERDELEVVRRLVSYGVVWHLALLLLFTPVAWLIAQYIVPHLSISSELLGTARNVFLLTFIYAFLGGAVRPLASLVIGLEHMWLTSLATIAGQLVYAVGVVGLLRWGAGIYALPLASLLSLVVLGVAYYVSGRRLIGRVFGNPLALDSAIRRDLLRFGSWFQVTNLARVVNTETDSILIATFVNVRSVGYYGIGDKIAQLVRVFPLAMLPPLLPALTGIHAHGDEKRIARTVLNSSRMLGLLTIAATGFVLAASPLLMTVWLGRSYPYVATITALLVCAYALNNFTGVGTTTVAALGMPRVESEYAVLGMTVNIGATLALAPFFGLWGVIGGTVIGIALCSVYFIWRFHRLMGLALWEYFGSWASRLCAAAAIPTIVAYLVRSVLPASVAANRAQGAVALAGLAALYLVLLLGALRLFRFLEARDLAVLRRVLPARLRPIASLPAVEFLFGART
jgi:O-antigen/teichoic acid export membrane protein